MPARRYFIVTQTREVKVSADKPVNAFLLAERIFSGTKKSEDQLNIHSEIIEYDLHVREERDATTG
jgi:hypothetical protein